MVNSNVINEMVERIKAFDPEKIILFGSYAYGTPTEHSDVDLLVVKNIENAEIRPVRLLMREKLRDIIYNQRVPVDLLLDSEQHINERIAIGDTIYAEIMQKGRTVYAK